MLSRVFAQSLPRSSETARLTFSISRAHIQRWSVPDSRISFSTAYRILGRSGPTSSTALNKMSPNCDPMSSIPLPQNCATPQLLDPHIHEPISGWRPLSVCDPGNFCQDELLRIVSWNIHYTPPGCARRASAAMNHLKEIFENSPPSLVIMLQEVSRQSLAAILAHPWVRDNFLVSNIEAPQRYFTIMMISRQVQAKAWFRMPFPSKMERDVLVVDIPILTSGKDPKKTNKILRLCTTHLESLPETEGSERRPLQMAQISALMKAPPTRCGRIVAGLVGGDMNTISQLDAASHKAENVELRDIWEDISPPPIPQLKPFQKDLTLGRARGNTWGYQSRGPRARKRLDKFFYTGSADTVPLLEAQDLTGKIGRLGIGVKTKVEVCEYEQKGIYKVGRGRWVEKWVTDHIDPEREWRADLEKYPSYSDVKERHKNLLETGVRKEIDVWVSDHFGITVGLRVH